MQTPETYTFTARSSENPDQVMTFTLHDDRVRVNYTGMLEKLGKIRRAEDRREEVKIQAESQMRPSAFKLAESLSGPLHVSDMRAELNGGLKINAWQRLRGLRLAPIAVDFGPVDNPEAAEAFVDELEERQEASARAGRFRGPLDYWFGWLAILIGFVALLRWPWRRS